MTILELIERRPVDRDHVRPLGFHKPSVVIAPNGRHIGVEKQLRRLACGHRTAQMIAEVDDALDILLGNILENGPEGIGVAVDVGDDGEASGVEISHEIIVAIYAFQTIRRFGYPG
jgi:hypothetical protein